MKTAFIKTDRTYIPKKYDIRWVLIYKSGIKRGFWSRAADEHREQDKASKIDRSGLIEACVEVQNRITWETKIVARCTKAEYIKHEWTVAAMAPMGLNIPIKTFGAIHGMKLITRDKIVEFFIDGRTKIEDNNEKEIINYT